MEITNPFANDEFKQTLLQKEGIIDNTDYEIPEPVDDLDVIVSKAPKIPGGNQISNIIHDADTLARYDKDQKAQKMTNALNELFTQYNEKYGVKLNLSFNDLSKSLVLISDSNTKRALELAVSEIFGGVKSLIYLRMISGISLLVENLLDPESLFSSELTLPDRFTLMDKLLGYIMQIEELSKSIEIKGSSEELKQLGKEAKEDSGDISSKLSPDAKEFLRLMKKGSIGKE